MNISVRPISRHQYSLTLRIALLMLILLSSRLEAGNSFYENTHSKNVRILYEGSLRYFSDTILTALTFLESDFDNCTFINTTFDNCSLRYRGYISYVSADTLRFVNCDIPEVSFSFGKLKNLQFIDCEIGMLEFKDISQLENVNFRNCKITELRILKSSVEKLTLLLSECNRFILEDCESKSVSFSLTKSGQILLRRGNASEFNIRDIVDKGTTVSFEYIEINKPNISPDFAGTINFKKAIFPDDFVLMQDYQSDNGEFGTKVSRESYSDAIAIYSVIRNQFREIGIGRVERRMEYLLKAAERKSLSSFSNRFFTLIWDEQCRGYYGTSPMIVLRSAFWIWLMFAFTYFSLGKLRIAWGASIEVSALGERINNINPQLFIHRANLSNWQYALACLSFSFDQLLIVGVRQGFRVSHFTEQLMKVPRRYIGVGFGRIISGIESIIGLIILFNFVQAFIRSL